VAAYSSKMVWRETGDSNYEKPATCDVVWHGGRAKGEQKMNTPQRIQRKRAKGWKMPENTVYVGRSTKWGNPWRAATPHINGKIEKTLYVKNQAAAAQRYKEYILKWGVQLHIIDAAIRELKGKNLACWCPLDKPCHADVLLQIANV
jgi:hypothetical protein